ncbi:MAG TPA: hypothetical protein VFH68_27310 [Polyangia bacterium]|jgi:hypothetical protein|nr:hypothetical protein [Polyangia bacterium]
MTNRSHFGTPPPRSWGFRTRAPDNWIRIASLLGLAGLLACSGGWGYGSDAAVTCGNLSCSGSREYCLIQTGGAGGRSGNGSSPTIYTTYRCAPLPADCGHAPTCECGRDDNGGVIMTCRSA